ncbi:MAG: hypothetical protein AB7O97_10685 [Planctomycetota bacterium]
MLSGAAPAQATLLVGPGGFAQLDAAIAAASPGDFVQVATGTYLPFTCSKGVTIAAAPGADVRILPTPSLAAAATVFQIPAGQSARVFGLHFDTAALRVQTTRVLAGTATFELCSFTGSFPQSETLLVQNASAWLRGCQMGALDSDSPCAALRAQNAAVAAVDCDFVGSRARNSVSDGGPGVDASGSSLHLSRCQLRGGDSGGSFVGGEAVRTDRGDLTWISDSVLTAGAAVGIPNVPLHYTGATPPHIARTSRNGSFGPPVIQDHLVGFAEATQTLQRGGVYRVDWQTLPNGVLAVLFSDELDAQPPILTLESTWLPALGTQWLATLVADGTGRATFTATVPNSPALRDIGVWLHAGDPLATPWRAAPPVGGLLR